MFIVEKNVEQVMLHKKENKSSKIVAFLQAFFYLCNKNNYFFTCTLIGTYSWTTITEQQCSIRVENF